MRGMMLRKTPLFFALLAITACGGDSGTNPTNAGIAGRYDLRAVNGQAVPATLVVDDVSGTYESGFIQITEPNSFNASLTATLTDAETGISISVTVPIAGTWTRSNDDIQFVDADGDSYAGKISNGQLTLTFDDGVELTFRK